MFLYYFTQRHGNNCRCYGQNWNTMSQGATNPRRMGTGWKRNNDHRCKWGFCCAKTDAIGRPWNDFRLQRYFEHFVLTLKEIAIETSNNFRVAFLSNYSGYGLSAMVEVLTGIMSGSNYASNIRRWTVDDGLKYGAANLGQVFIAVDPNCFAPGFEDRMSDLNGILRNLPPVRNDDLLNIFENSFRNIQAIYLLCHRSTKRSQYWCQVTQKGHIWKKSTKRVAFSMSSINSTLLTNWPICCTFQSLDHFEYTYLLDCASINIR